MVKSRVCPQVWPAAARESLFWSHLRRVDSWKSAAAHDCYVVCNKDIKRDDVPVSTVEMGGRSDEYGRSGHLLQKTSSSAIRVGLTVAMICETHVENPKVSGVCSLVSSYCSFGH